MSDSRLQQLEEKFDALVRASRRMRERYQASLAREAALREERADLIKKNDLARAKVEAIISRLRELEQN
jgi:cell division protein ZapB